MIQHSEPHNQGESCGDATIPRSHGRSHGPERGANPHGRQRLFKDKSVAVPRIVDATDKLVLIRPG